MRLAKTINIQFECKLSGKSKDEIRKAIFHCFSLYGVIAVQIGYDVVRISFTTNAGFKHAMETLVLGSLGCGVPFSEEVLLLPPSTYLITLMRRRMVTSLVSALTLVKSKMLISRNTSLTWTFSRGHDSFLSSCLLPHPAPWLLVVVFLECGIKASLLFVTFALCKTINLQTVLTRTSVITVGLVDILPVIAPMREALLPVASIHHPSRPLVRVILCRGRPPVAMVILHRSRPLLAIPPLPPLLRLIWLPRKLLLLIPLRETPSWSLWGSLLLFRRLCPEIVVKFPPLMLISLLVGNLCLKMLPLMLLKSVIVSAFLLRLLSLLI